MKRLSKSIHRKLPPMLLYLEDIERLFEVFQHHHGKVSLKTNDFEMDGLEELRALKPWPTYLSIKSTTPTFSVEFSGSDASIFAATDDTLSLGVVSELESAAAPAKRKLLAFIISPLFRWQVLPVGGVAGYLLSSGEKNKVVIGLGVALYAFIMLAVNAYFEQTHYSKICLSNAPDGFMRRNKDRLLVGVLLALLAAALAFISK